MVSKEDGQEVETPQEGKKPPQEDPGTEKKEEITGVDVIDGPHKPKKELKPGEQVAFPLGGHSTASLVKEVTGTSPEDKDPPPENEGGKQDITNPLEGGEKPSPEEKEDNMPLDEEGKRFVTDSIEGEIKPLRQKLGVLDKVTQVIEANKKTLQAIQEKVSTEETKPKETRVDPEEVARRAIQMIREEDKQKREEREQEEARKREREEHQDLVIFCRNNPDSQKCKAKTLPGTVREIIAEELKKREEATPKAEEKKPETPAGLGPLEAMTAEKRKAYTPEQNKQRNDQAMKLMNKLNITFQDAWNMLERSPEDLQTIKQKFFSKMSDSDLEQLIKSQSEAQKGEVIGVLCEGGECKVKYKDKGFIAMSEDDLKKLVDKKVEEELKKIPHI